MLIPSPVVAALPPDALLPDLGMAPLTNFRIERRPRGERWLRFSTVIVNVGDGPFEVVRYMNEAGELQVDQRVLTGSGSWAYEPTAAVMYWSGDGHNHMHVGDLQEYVLVSQNGLVRRYGEKHGFCFWDNYQYNLSLPDAPPDPVYTGSNSCQDLDGTVQMGLSVGWGDEYPYYLVDQYIKISGLPAGEYTVTATADWDNWFVETNNDNNRTEALIRLSKNGVTVLDPGIGP
jgi:hypothetical protein